MFIHIEAISSFFPVKSVEPLHFWYGFESGEQCHVATPFLEGHLSVYTVASILFSILNGANSAQSLLLVPRIHL